MLDSAPSSANTHRILAEHGVRPTLGSSLPTIDLVRALIGRGLGYGLLMSRPNSPDTTSEGLPLVTIPLSPRTGLTSVVAAWPRHMTLSPAHRCFSSNWSERCPKDLAVVDVAIARLVVACDHQPCLSVRRS